MTQPIQPRNLLPHMTALSQQLQGMISRYRIMLDDEFVFGSGAQMPQVATILDRAGDTWLRFKTEQVTLTEMLTLIAYRYGFESLRQMGHGGYAIVMTHAQTFSVKTEAQRRVFRLVPDHHVRDVLRNPADPRPYDVELDANNEPIRHPDYPLILSDLFLLPRHTTKLIFHERNGKVAQAGGYRALLHCQLLPEVRALNSIGLDTQKAKDAGNLLEMALATLGVAVADAHGGNGGVLLNRAGDPLTFDIPQADGTTEAHYIPVVLDFGYYSTIGSKRLARVLENYGVTPTMMHDCLRQQGYEPDIPTEIDLSNSETVQAHYIDLIEKTDIPRHLLGRLLYHTQPQVLYPKMWIEYAEHHWETTKEHHYPALDAQSHLVGLYPQYDEVVFPQKIEEYHFIL
ncbi:MAG: hypothetical protein AAF126_17290 [Chloroflexota bacterium]